jgi:serine/threonine protein phosphatase PrpC
LSKQLRLDVAQLTDVGRKRPHNEDNMAYVMPKDPQVMTKKGALFIVADGMGGHAAGEVASEIAVDTISNVYYQQDDGEDAPASLLRAIKRANTLIRQRAAENMSRSGMGTTCVSAILRGGTAYIANVGDSRAYLVRAGQVRQVSQDHSWVEEQVRAGLLSRDQARSHAQRNVVTRALGTQSEVEVDIFTEKIEDGDTFILCSDGLSGQVSDDELHTIVDKYQQPQESVYRLVERANENGGPDNITAIIIHVLDAGWDPYPVPVGGRELANAETSVLSRASSSSLRITPKIDESQTQPMPPARLNGSANLQEPSRTALAPARHKNRRLLLPTAAFLVLVIVALVVGGSYYFLRPILFPTTNVDASLSDASTQVAQAKKNLGANQPGNALRALSSAQKDLRSLDHIALSASQNQNMKQLQNDLVSTTQSAITGYDQQSLIASLPCPSTTSAAINNGSTNTQPIAVATANDAANKAFRYALGADHNLYQLDNGNTLTTKQSLPGNPRVSFVNSDQQHILVLTSMTKNNATKYSLDVLAPKAGTKPDVAVTTLDTYTKNGVVPTLLTAWQSDTYLVLTSPTAPNSATILDFSMNNGKLGNPRSLQISISTSIASVAAFPNHQLFLLNGDGNIQSLQFGSNSQASSVVSQHPIPLPLTTSAKDFSLQTDVPVPGQPSSSFLALPVVSHAAFLTANLVSNAPRLYVIDGFYHRIIALQVAQNSVTPMPTPANGGKTGGGVATQAQPLTMSLVQQFVSNDLFNTVKGVATDPKNATLYLLTSNGQASQSNLVSVGVDPQANACTP